MINASDFREGFCLTGAIFIHVEKKTISIAVSVLKMVAPVLVMIIIGMILRTTKLVSFEGTIVGATGLGNLFFPTAVGGIFTEIISLITSPTNALILYFFLPAPLFIPIYTKTKEDSEFLSTSLSMYMAVTIIAFIVMAVVFATN